MANTGYVQVISLKKVKNPGGIPTGDVKPNLPTDPNYIAPYLDLLHCPVVYDLACPSGVTYTHTSTTLQWEVQINNDVILNPLVKKIVIALNTGGFSTTFVLPTNPPNYFSGQFTGLTPSTTYTMVITYLGAGDVVLATCTA